MSNFTRIEGGGDKAKRPPTGELVIHPQNGQCLPLEKRTHLIKKQSRNESLQDKLLEAKRQKEWLEML